MSVAKIFLCSANITKFSSLRLIFYLCKTNFNTAILMKDPFGNILRQIFCLLFILLLHASSISAQQKTVMPGEDGNKPAINYEYFPDRQYAFVWRNWSVVDKARLAEVMATSVENVERLAESMGLSRQQKLEPEWATTRGYITILRRNWHLLPYDQLTLLLGMEREELKYRLIEDDFLWEKLGSVKPQCDVLRYVEPDAEMLSRVAQFREDVAPLIDVAYSLEDERFGFMREFDKVKKSKHSIAESQHEGFELRMIFPYFADYGDPLLDEELTSYPEELFRRLSGVGVNGVWLHYVLRMMVLPTGGFPGDEKALERKAGLQRLVDRAAKYGIKIYLYLNEPRAMHKEYFDGNAEREALAGPEYQGLRSFCTSKPEVLGWMSRSMEELFSEVEGLGGVFTITASENYTSCASRGYAHERCPLCKDRAYADLIVDVNTAIEQGVHRGNPDAKVIVWDWGWPETECEQIISRLPKSCWFMAVSEWAKPIERGGVKSLVGEYSLSAVGPGPRALRNWALAREAGLKTVAKVQVNATWEMAAVPSVPVLDLVAQHAENLSGQDVNGVMLSWSLGGYPSENLKLFQSFRRGDTAAAAVERLALAEYGEKAAPKVREAWRVCSEGFENFPFSMRMLYSGPQHMGPSNPIYTKPSGYPATFVVGIPYDDVHYWKTIYPLPVWFDLMDKSADGFGEGAKLLKEALKVVDGKHRKALEAELGRMQAVYNHLKSGVEQGRFIDARNRYAEAKDDAAREECKAVMRRALDVNKRLIAEHLEIVVGDSSIGFESSSQYFYVPADLVEAYASVCYAQRWVDSLK